MAYGSSQAGMGWNPSHSSDNAWSSTSRLPGNSPVHPSRVNVQLWQGTWKPITKIRIMYKMEKNEHQEMFWGSFCGANWQVSIYEPSIWQFRALWVYFLTIDCTSVSWVTLRVTNHPFTQDWVLALKTLHSRKPQSWHWSNHLIFLSLLHHLKNR